jgi:hypothetical protein
MMQPKFGTKDRRICGVNLLEEAENNNVTTPVPRQSLAQVCQWLVITLYEEANLFPQKISVGRKKEKCH